MKTKLLIQSSLLQALYWAIYLAVYTYAAVYLQALGFSTFIVGILIASGSIISSVLQPTLGSLPDRYPRITAHRLTIASSAVCGILLVVVCIHILPAAAEAVLYALAIALVLLQMSLVNSVSVYYINRGIDLNYGFARGFGSIGYAACSTLLGSLLAVYSEEILPYFGIVIAVLTILLVVLMPSMSGRAEASAEAAEEATSASSLSLREFLRKYAAFFLTVLGITLCFASYTSVNSYMINVVEAVGGNTADMGHVFTLCAVVELPTMFGFSQLIRRFPTVGMMVFCAAAFVGKAACYAAAGSVAVLLAAQIFQTFSYALYIPVSVYYAREMMEETDQFKGQAFMTMAITVGGVLGSLLGGAEISFLGLRPMLLTMVGLAVLGFLIVVLSNIKTKKRSGAKTPA